MRQRHVGLLAICLHHLLRTDLLYSVLNQYVRWVLLVEMDDTRLRIASVFRSEGNETEDPRNTRFPLAMGNVRKYKLSWRSAHQTGLPLATWKIINNSDVIDLWLGESSRILRSKCVTDVQSLISSHPIPSHPILIIALMSINSWPWD